MFAPDGPLKLKPSLSTTPKGKAINDWRILVVDDENDVHEVTKLILNKIKFENRSVEMLSAYSSTEAIEILSREKDIALILLDVVMETDDAGLKLVKIIREDMRNNAVRIILRTGQPGQVPEEQIIVNYDINDYKSKADLTSKNLFTAVISSLRSYSTIAALEKTRHGLEAILSSSGSLFNIQSVQQFASGILTQLSEFLACSVDGIICAELNAASERESDSDNSNISVLAASGEYSDCSSSSIENGDEYLVMANIIKTTLREKKDQISDEFTALFFETGDQNGTVALLRGGIKNMNESDYRLLKVFTSKISIAFSNAYHYQRMITAEEAAVTDFLTGLNNRRQLIRLGVPMVAGACRGNKTVAVAMLDIDYFKRINDNWGHDVGDDVLRRIGKLLKDRFRASDIISRFGGEEFCIIVANLSPKAAIELFDDFRASFEKEIFEIEDETVSFTFSIGVCTEVMDNVKAMISAADQLLYQAKETGRNRVIGSY
jgi:diguanylate cyclase (GGDEF)-like protein